MSAQQGGIEGRMLALGRFAGDYALQLMMASAANGANGASGTNELGEPPTTAQKSVLVGAGLVVGGALSILVWEALFGVEAFAAAKLMLVPPAILQGAPTLYNLGRDLASAEASSIFTEEGGLTAEAIASSRMIIPSFQLSNPAIEEGFSKFATQTYLSPSGPFQVHFYMDAAGMVNYLLDYKAVFNYGITPWNLGH